MINFLAVMIVFIVWNSIFVDTLLHEYVDNILRFIKEVWGMHEHSETYQEYETQYRAEADQIIFVWETISSIGIALTCLCCFCFH